MSIIKISDRVIKKQKNFWNNIHFHPTDAIEDEWGQRILNDVAQDKVADTVRMYAMLEDIVSMDENGKLHYDFTENDVRMDYMISKGFHLLVSYNYIPPCIAQDPTVTNSVNKNKTRYKGKLIVTSPPKDYGLWEEVCYEYTRHIVERYGLERVSSWYLECYNEPDIQPFFMTDIPREMEETRAKEYCKLYHGFVNGVCRVSRALTIGGPAMAARMNFLAIWVGYVKKHQLKMDFFTAHSYGTSCDALNDGTGSFHALNNVLRNKKYLDTMREYFPEGMDVIIDEWGAISQAYKTVHDCSRAIFRETEQYAAYYGKMITKSIEMDVVPKKMMICLAGQHEMTEPFTGFRNFFTLHHIKKPIYNAYVLGRKLKENVLKWDGEEENLCVLPTRDDKGRHAVMLSYASADFEQEIEDFHGTLEIENVYGKKHVAVWVIDKIHTNPYALYVQKVYSPDLTREQIALLQKEGSMKPVKEYECEADGTLAVEVTCSNNGLIRVEF